MPKLKPPKAFLDKAKKDECSKENQPKYTRYYKAVVQGDILKVAIWTRAQLVANDIVPTYEVYIDKENETWLNYSPKTNSWGKARIENLKYDYYIYDERDYYGVRGYDTETDRKLVNEYLGSRQKNILVRDAVKSWQKDLADASLRRRYISELEHIDSVMNLVPELPKAFEKWATTEAFFKAQYIIYSRNEKKAYCTNCEKELPLKMTYKHNEVAKCPKCHIEATCKSWNMQEAVYDRKEVSIIQNLKDGSGYILRKFEANVYYRKADNYKMEWDISEDARFRLNESFVDMETFEWAEYKHTGKVRWCHEIPRGLYYGYRLSTNSILYPKNIKSLLSDTELKYMPIAELLRKNKGKHTNPDVLLGNAMKMPQIEMLIKVGLYRLAYQYCNGRSYNTKMWNRESPWNYLKISKEYFELAKKMNAKEEYIDVMRAATERNVMLNEEQIIFYAGHLRSKTKEFLELGHTEKVYKYLLELKSENGSRVINDYADYIEDLKKLQIPLTKRVLFPKNFQTEHQEVAEMRRELDNKLAAMELRKKNREFRKMLPKVRKLFEAADEDFVIVIPTCKKDFQDEGREQHNCVGGSYFDRMLKGECFVVFLRKQSDPKKSFCTVEFTPSGAVRQNRIINNREAPQEAQDFINKLSKRVSKEIIKQQRKAAIEAEKKELAKAQ